MVDSEEYVPRRGDLVWLNFSPQAGHEQRGHRPALVLSPRRYNERAGLALLCPITSRVRGYPFEVALPDTLETEGVVLADQVRSLDWRKRGAECIESSPPAPVGEAIAKIQTLLE
ncbi:MAG: mRNA-degrading endonuclease [Bacteroidetes bacterium QH_2_63_10]|nr:MAG: mRNA-degrading endonuclease [Bacteroidetes bacterium QH_2_63_10]